MTHTADPILVQDADGIRSIVLNRAGKANALCAAMLDTMVQAIARAPEDGAGMILLRSASPALFCAGGDIDEFALGPGSLEKQGDSLRELMTVMARCPLPILAIAQGKAAGAGVILLAMTDIVIAAQDLALSCPEIAFNMYPVMVQIALETKISAAQARRLCLSGDTLGAAAARDLGLATDVLPADGFAQRAEQRLAYYSKRREALNIARQGRLATESPAAMLRRLATLEPLMHRNFNRPGVRETILAYLDGLRRKRPGQDGQTAHSD